MKLQEGIEKIINKLWDEWFGSPMDTYVESYGTANELAQTIIESLEIDQEKVADIIFRDEIILDDSSYHIPRRTIDACRKVAKALTTDIIRIKG